MKKINIKNAFKHSSLLAFTISATFISLNLNAQLLTARPEMSAFGKYNVKMISSQVLQSVWLSSKDPYTAIRPLTDDEMARDYTSLNNGTSLGNSAYSSTGINLLTKPANAVDISQIYADCDEDTTTWQSSAAYLDYGQDKGCASVYKAYLYWNVFATSSTTTSYAKHFNVGSTLRSMPANSNEGIGGTTYQTVLFKTPGDTAYKSVTTSRILTTADDGERKVCFADVTDLVKGKTNGLYWLANVHSGTALGQGGASAGWSLIIIYSTPNCPPRTIKFWDGSTAIFMNNSSNIVLTMSANEVPSTENNTSYLGIGVLDGENTAAYLAKSSVSPEFLEISSSSSSKTGSVYKINPFAPGQTAPNVGEPQAPYATYSNVGILYSDSSYDGFSCSRISAYDPVLGTNGNSIVRLPNQRNTLGYDAHLLKLPSGAIISGATSVTMKYYAGPQGGTNPFLAFMAIEGSRPILKAKLQAEAEKTTPGGVVSYILTVKNIGSSALDSGAYVLDTLDQSVDFAPNSVEYVNKTVPKSYEVTNQGGDVNEQLKLYLPTLAAGDGTNASDSVIIKFKVNVKDLSRMDIWNLICHRVVKNSASAYYNSSNGDEYTAVTNTANGCGIPNEYVDVYVNDSTITQQHLITHYISDSIYDKLLIAAKTGTPIKIKTLVRQYLAERLISLGKSASDTASYSIFDENGLEVSPSTVFTLDESDQKFIGEVDLGLGCVETFNFEFIITPRISNLQIQNPRCTGNSDGKISFNVSKGMPGYTCSVVDSLDESKIIYQSVALASDTIASFEIDNLPAGTYKIYAGDQGAVKAVKTVKLVNPLPLTVTISAPDSMCNGYDATLTANASGRDANTTLSYVWESSTDSAAWITLPVNTQSTTSTISENKYFRVYVCDNYCETNSLVKVNVNNTPNCKVATNVVNTEKESAIIIYPNPAKTAFTIQTGQAENEVKVFDMKGAIILQQSVADKSHINVSAWEKGTYIVEINNKKVKLIKE